jgi:uncharacterized protein YdeI (YjbR/CyaY-like superfamily)
MTDAIEHLNIDSAKALWDWLEAHHATGQSRWLVTWKKAPGAPYVSRDEVLDALIAHGWIDGRRMKHPDPARTMQLIAPRKQGIWAQTYKDRAGRLIAEGRMRPPGQAAIDAAKAAGLWEEWSDVDALEVPQDLSDALALRPGAADWFTSAAPSYRRNVLRYLRGAKRRETRAKRVAQIADHAARGERVPQY